MNTNFNINRLGLLLKRFFIENGQKELTFWAISIVVFMLAQEPAASGMFIFIAGFIFAGKVFKTFRIAPGAMHYLLIPATHLEKLVSGIILSTLYFLISILLCYFVGNIAGTYLGNLILGFENTVHFKLFETANAINNMNESGSLLYLINMFVGFAITQSIFMLGSIYFKGNTVGKTILSIIVFSIVIGIVELTLIKLNFDTTNLRNQNINLSLIDTKTMFPGLDIVGQIIKYAAAPFFWIVSYYRLTEKEV